VLKVWIVGKDLADGSTGRQLPDDRTDRHSQATNAGKPAHTLGIDGDAFEGHPIIVGRRRAAARRTRCPGVVRHLVAVQTALLRARAGVSQAAHSMDTRAAQLADRE
jgi:hypothetical protein